MTEKLKQKYCRVFGKILGLTFAVAIFGAPFQSVGAISTSLEGVAIQSPVEPVAEGQIFIITVKSEEKKLENVLGEFQGHEIPFFPNGEKAFSAFVGVELDTGDAQLPLTLRVQIDHSDKIQIVQIPTKEGVFHSETLKVQPRKIKPLKKDMVRIRQESQMLGRIYSVVTPQKYWNPPLALPLNSIITSEFGSRRVYNRVKQSAHVGTDFRAPPGTIIRVPMTGRVVMARDLFYTGNTIILDHGYGLFTIYAHMSKFFVQEGRLVKKRQKLGLSGATGRVSGPHLHWGVNLHGAKIDPMNLVAVLKQAASPLEAQPVMVPQASQQDKPVPAPSQKTSAAVTSDAQSEKVK